jgi:hypothetical protein
LKRTKKQKPFQKKGSETRKAAIEPRVIKRLEELREAVAAGTLNGPFSKNFVLKWIPVDKNTINNCAHHAKSAKAIRDFLDETDRACGIIEHKPKKQEKKRSLRQQMAELAEEAEATRLRLQHQIDDLMDQLQPKGKGRRPNSENFRSIARIKTPTHRRSGMANVVKISQRAAPQS